MPQPSSIDGVIERPPRPLSYAFEAADDARPSAVQHLLLGMNAHISFDPPISTRAISETMASPTDPLAALRRDFFEINRVLASMVDLVQEDLNRFSPALARIDRWGGPVDEALATFGLERLRADA